MTRTLDDARSWADSGTQLFAQALQGCSDEQSMGEASQLDGWTRKHLVAHVAANADALCNLVHWASTGEETPMYSSSEQRNADIEAGAAKAASELVAWSQLSAAKLEQGLAGLTSEQWQHEVRTAQGRTVNATEVPWMRAREVNIHAIDLGTGTTWQDLPEGFLLELIGEITAKRSGQGNGPALELVSGEHQWQVSGEGEPTRVAGPLPEVAAYLAGREHRLTMPDGTAAPALPAWL